MQEFERLGYKEGFTMEEGYVNKHINIQIERYFERTVKIVKVEYANILI
jgi:hypothetical protein